MKGDMPLNKETKSCHKEWVGSCGIVANVPDCNIVVSEFKLEELYYIHFHTYIFGKDMNTLIILVKLYNYYPLSMMALGIE